MSLLLLFAAAAGTSYTVAADSGTFSLSGQDATINAASVVSAAQASFSLAAQNTGVSLGQTIAAEQGSFTLSGQTATPTVAYTVPAAQGTYALTGQTATAKWAAIVPSASGAYTLIGQDADIRFSGRTDWTITADVGSFTLGGQSAGVVLGQGIMASAGTFALTGQPVTLHASFAIAASQGSYAFTGKSATIDIIVPSVQLGLTNQSSPLYRFTSGAAAMYRCADRSDSFYSCEINMSQIDCAVDFEAAVYIERPRLGTAATGLTGVTFWLSATRGGTAIHASLSAEATEDADNPGTYVATFDQSDIAAQLASYANKQVFLVVTKTGDIYRKSFPHVVLPLGA